MNRTVRPLSQYFRIRAEYFAAGQVRPTLALLTCVLPPLASAAPPLRTPLSSASVSATLTFVVNSTGGIPDAHAGDGRCATALGGCFLHAAIQEPNVHLAADTIALKLSPARVHTIQLTGSLLILTDLTGGTTIDSYTQPGAAPNGNGANPTQRLDTITITPANNLIRGLSLHNLKRPFRLYGRGATDNVIVDNFSGADATGKLAASAYTAATGGAKLREGVTRNQIGGTSAADRNMIWGSARKGIATCNASTRDKLILNNHIGLAHADNHRLTSCAMLVRSPTRRSADLGGGRA